MKVWESSKYYDLAEKGSRDLSHPGMKILVKYAKNAEKILDLGCGEGSRLSMIAKKGYGVDISQVAIRRAKRYGRSYKFIKMDLAKLKFPDEMFDLIYSAYVLEHLEKPETMLKEAVRVLKKNGSLILLAPNYGSPNRASPVNREGSRINKFIKGIMEDYFTSNNGILRWNKVVPDDKPETYYQDSDTVCEPYIGSLIKYLKYLDLDIVYTDSCWDQELPDAKLIQRILRIIANYKIFPFTLWGPHLVVVSRK